MLDKEFVKERLETLIRRAVPPHGLTGADEYLSISSGILRTVSSIEELISRKTKNIRVTYSFIKPVQLMFVKGCYTEIIEDAKLNFKVTENSDITLDRLNELFKDSYLKFKSATIDAYIAQTNIDTKNEDTIVITGEVELCVNINKLNKLAENFALFLKDNWSSGKLMSNGTRFFIVDLDKSVMGFIRHYSLEDKLFKVMVLNKCNETINKISLEYDIEFDRYLVSIVTKNDTIKIVTD